MKWHTWAGIGLLTLVSTATAQNIGDVTPIDLPGGGATLTLDFAERDYELILYSTVTDEPDSSRTFGYTVSSPSTSPLVHRSPWPAPSTERDRLEALLRQRERALAARLREAGGWRPPLHKAVQPLQGSTRTFTFPAFGGVTADQTVEATLVASNARALGYLDNALTSGGENITTPDIQAMLDRFDAVTSPLVTGTFGAASDVDGDGRVLFLYTPLVDRVGSVAGFYSSGSLFSTDRGGDGNIADMMFISPTRPLIAYESLLAHEFQHLISFNQHALLRNGKGEESWLNEALSHVTEDLVNGHIDGGNPDLVGTFMETPGAYALTGDALLNSGIRGAAYLFLRSLIEDFGDGIPGQLVQTERTGIPNVEAITARSFQDLYRTFAARLFLSGNGLNEASGSNYAFQYFTEPETKRRSLPTPRQQRLSAGQFPVSGTVKPAALAFIHLTGSGPAQPVEIQTEAGGSFRALTIPLPKDFAPRLALPVDYFPGIKLNAPLPGTYAAGESVVFSGTVQDVSITQILLTFKPRAGQGDEITYQIEVTGGQFSQSIVFAPSQAGEHTLDLFAGQKGNLLPSVGTFPGVTVTEGTGTVDLPAGFFSDIAFDAPLPTQYRAGSGTSLSGRVTDSAIEVLLLVFTSEAGSEIRVQTDVSNSAFRKGFVFTPQQVGTYSLDVFGGPRGGSLLHRGNFSPVTVTATGAERVYLPVDLFDNLLLDRPLTAGFFAGKQETFSGQATDSGITRVAISFIPASGGPSIDTFTDVENSRFSANLTFESSQTGTYTVRIFGGQAGQSLPFLGEFSPVEVFSSRPDLLLRQTALTWGELEVGQTRDLPLTLVNSGSEALVISSISLNSDLFSAAPATLTLSPGDSATVTLTFAPTAEGTVAGSLQILTNDPDRATVQIALSGSATVPRRPTLLLRQTALTFEGVEIGQTRDLPLTLVNSGAGDLIVSRISSEGDPFSVTGESFTLSPGDSATVTLTFAPTAEGAASGTLQILTNDPDRATVLIALSGTAVSPAPPTSPSADFNGDGRVNFPDFLAFAGGFGARRGGANYSAAFDLDGSGDIGFPDFLIFAAAFGQSTGG